MIFVIHLDILYTLLNGEVVKRIQKKEIIIIIHVNMDGITQVSCTWHTNNTYRDCAAQRSSLNSSVKIKEKNNISQCHQSFLSPLAS